MVVDPSTSPIADLESRVRAIRTEVARLNALLGHYQTVLADLRSKDSPPPRIEQPAETSPELNSLLASGELSVFKAACAVVYFEGAVPLDRVFRHLLASGLARPGSKGKDRVRAIVQGRSSGGRLAVNKQTKLYDFASAAARAWFKESVLTKAPPVDEYAPLFEGAQLQKEDKMK